MATYKSTKEAFVAGNTGASILSINLTSGTALLGYASYALVSRRFGFHPLLDYVTTVLPLLLGTTIFESTLASLIPVALGLAFVVHWTKEITQNATLTPIPPPAPNSARIPLPSDSHHDHLKIPDSHTSSRSNSPFLSVYRAHMMIMTVICILAVDFKVFPRRQGKCEDFGTSLMDVGVGSFVFSLGIVSLRSYQNIGTANSLSRISISLRKSAPLILLGMMRVIMVKGSDYPEHVTEYGVHWNFFFTLALLPIFGEVLWPARQRHVNWTVLGILITILHQLALNRLDLQGYILSPERNGIIGLNKEGLVSLPGYLAIYLLGLGTGEYILQSVKQTTTSTRQRTLSVRLLAYTSTWWIALAVTQSLDLQVSRRMSNLPYVLWIAAFNTTFLLGYLYVETTLFTDATASGAVPPLLDAVNKNGMVVFLVANLLTGLINISVKTMYMGSLGSMSILVLYTGVVCGVAWYGRGFKLKL